MSLSTLGCSMLDSGIRNLVVEPALYPTQLDEHRTKERNEDLAEDLWQRIVSESGAPAVSNDYARGFLDGFSDYLFLGGSGEPPAIPPRDYWRIERRDGSSSHRVADWFAGFRHGSSVAKNEGFRDWEKIPSGFLLPYADEEGTMPHELPVGVLDVGYPSISDETPRQMNQLPAEETTPELELIEPPVPDDGWRGRGRGDQS